MRNRWIAGAIGVAVVAFVVYRSFFSAPPVPKRPPPPVVVQPASHQDVAVIDHTIGTVVSNATVQITARVQGQLMRAYFTEGQTVHKGDLLFQIDPGPYKAAYDSAVASLVSAKAKAERYARLLEQKAVAPQDADDARAAWLTAQANVDAARLNLDYTRITSPIDGKTGPILVQPGNMIMATPGGSGATTASAPAALVVITQMQPIKISFSLPQADLPRIQERLQAHTLSVSVDTHGAADAKPLTAPVDFVSNAVDDKTGTIELRGTFANEQSTLVPGQLVDIGVVLGTLKNATTVPHEAVNIGPNGRYLYIVRDGKAAMVAVDVLHDDGVTAAVQGPVKPGDKVVVDGQLRVIPGKPVVIAKPAKAAK